MAVIFTPISKFSLHSFPGVVLLDKVGIESRCLSNSDPYIAISYLFEYMLKPVIAVMAQFNQMGESMGGENQISKILLGV